MGIFNVVYQGGILCNLHLIIWNCLVCVIQYELICKDMQVRWNADRKYPVAPCIALRLHVRPLSGLPARTHPLLGSSSTLSPSSSPPLPGLSRGSHPHEAVSLHRLEFWCTASLPGEDLAKHIYIYIYIEHRKWTLELLQHIYRSEQCCFT